MEMSRLERKMMYVILKYKLGFAYVGDYCLFIDNKCPDFIHHSEKIIIEVFYKEIHEPDYEVKRKLFFNEKGYITIMIDETYFYGNGWEERLRDIIKNAMGCENVEEHTITKDNFKIRAHYLCDDRYGKIATEINKKLSTYNNDIIDKSTLSDLHKDLNDKTYARVLTILMKYNILKNPGYQYNKKIYTISNRNVSLENQTIYDLERKQRPERESAVNICKQTIKKWVDRNNLKSFSRKNIPQKILHSYSRATITRVLNKMIDDGIIMREGLGAYSYYEICTNITNTKF